MTSTPPRTSRDIHDLTPYLSTIAQILGELQALPTFDIEVLRGLFKRYPRDGNAFFSKNMLLRGYQQLVAQGDLPTNPDLVEKLQMKPTRTVSGVAPVTVLTKPYPCPGKCIFCPTDIRMPKSYLPDEPGAMRAEMYAFDPYEQTHNRIKIFAENGHVVDKIELLILGGTWSSYRKDYQAWFIQRCFDAMNERPSETLTQAQAWNETARHRNVGLVIETRPDHITPHEIHWLRQLGVTKVQMGAQSLDDAVLLLNKRGHTVAETSQAMHLLRAAGFKLVLHWMPNLLGATPESDLRDFAGLWTADLAPDEIKIYPCSLLPNAELYEYWKRGEYHPYSDDTLIDLVARCKALVPPYCRINRVYRDIPATNIVAGCTLSNLRQAVASHMREQGSQCRCIRCREVRGELIFDALTLNDYVYETRHAQEHFLSFDTAAGRLAGYLRLSLPQNPPFVGIPELVDAALVREVHVYGQAQQLGQQNSGRMQHSGLGTRLLQAAETQAQAAGYPKLAIIAAVGTRPYYAGRGYQLHGSYMVKMLL